MRIGYDVEAFIRGKNSLLPASDFVGGSKNAPISEGGYNMHPDNIMAEFSCTSPIDVEDLLDHIQSGTERIQQLLPEDATLVYSGAEDAAVLQDHPSMMDLGCQPDQVFGEVRSIGPADLGPVRCAGFHLHFDTLLPAMIAVHVCDTVLGLTSIVLGEDQGQRRQFYGKAGSFRQKPYGIEYRMLSADFVNIMKSDPRMTTAAIKLTAMVLANPEEIPDLTQLSMAENSRISEMINSNDIASATEFWKNYVYPHLEAIE